MRGRERRIKSEKNDNDQDKLEETLEGVVSYLVCRNYLAYSAQWSKHRICNALMPGLFPSRPAYNHRNVCCTPHNVRMQATNRIFPRTVAKSPKNCLRRVIKHRISGRSQQFQASPTHVHMHPQRQVMMTPQNLEGDFLSADNYHDMRRRPLIGEAS